jgi:hypothetical protein
VNSLKHPLNIPQINKQSALEWTYINIVAYRPVARKGHRKQGPFLGNGSVNTFPQQRIRTQQLSDCWKRGVFYVVRSAVVAMQRRGRHASTAIDGLCFLRGRAKELSWWYLGWYSCQLCSVREAVKERVSCRNAAVNSKFYMWYLKCVIQWDCYRSFVKIRCQEMASGGRNKPNIIVSVSVTCKMFSRVVNV